MTATPPPTLADLARLVHQTAVDLATVARLAGAGPAVNAGLVRLCDEAYALTAAAISAEAEPVGDPGYDDARREARADLIAAVDAFIAAHRPDPEASPQPVAEDPYALRAHLATLVDVARDAVDRGDLSDLADHLATDHPDTTEATP